MDIYGYSYGYIENNNKCNNCGLKDICSNERGLKEKIKTLKTMKNIV